jgi:hypothetical protein
MHNHGPKCVWGITHFPSENTNRATRRQWKKKYSRPFVLCLPLEHLHQQSVSDSALETLHSVFISDSALEDSWDPERNHLFYSLEGALEEFNKNS